MAKLLKLRRGTTSQHSSFTGAEGEVTVDTNKDVLVVHDGSTAGGHPVAAQDMDNVPAGAILGTQLENSGVTAGQYGSSSAIPIVTVDAQGLVTAASTTAIDSTTIANGTSNVAVANNGNITATRSGTARLVVDSAGVDVTGNINATGNITVSNGQPTLTFTDTDHNPDFLIRNADGGLIFNDATNAANRLVINSDGHVDVIGNLDVGSGVDVTGTLNGEDITATGLLKISNAFPRLLFEDINNNDDFSIYNANGTFRINDDTNSAARFDIASDGTVDIFGNLDVGAGLDVTGNTILTGSGTNAVEINGTGGHELYSYHDSGGVGWATGAGGSYGELLYLDEANSAVKLYTSGTKRFEINSGGSTTISGNTTVSGNLDCSSGVDVTGSITVTGTVDGRDVASDGSKLDNIETNATADQSAGEILTLIKTVDGDGSGLDADSLDGIGSSSFVRSDANDTMTGTYNISSKKLGLGTTPGSTFGNRNAALALGDNDTGFTQNGDGQLEAWANNQLRLLWTSGDMQSYATFRPAAGSSVDLGTSSYRWNNIYTNDLHLSNEGHTNDVDGTWGNWTIQEGESDLFLKNNRSGKKYKFNLTEVS